MNKGKQARLVRSAIKPLSGWNSIGRTAMGQMDARFVTDLPNLADPWSLLERRTELQGPAFAGATFLAGHLRAESLDGR